MTHKTISHYQIIKNIGAGGMGEVFLAEDTRLARKVAIKLLPSRFTDDENRLRRFEQEARAASALNHPNIITIYDIGQADDARFIATEFVEGETIRRRISESRLDVHEILDISIQVAEALSAAHEAGIIHRDIKPENIMVRRDGYVKVLDFGLAKLVERPAQSVDPEAPTAIMIDTDPGMVMGTVNYMSPEQARGIAVDARTDIFSLGVIMYEMLAGRSPFRGGTATDVIISILQTEPPPIAEFSPDVPAALDRSVSKALVKDRNERYQTATDFAADLRRLKRRLELEVDREHAKQSTGDVETEAMGAASNAPTGARVSAPIRSQEVPVRPTSNPEQIVGRLKRHKKSALAVVILLAAVLTGGAYLLSTVDRGEPIGTLAVLPFVNASSDPNAEYLSDGITESLINSLSQLPNLKVMSRNSVFRYRISDSDSTPDARAVGRDLSVRAVLTGRLVQHGDSLSIITELVDARDNTHIWGEQYNRRLADVLAVQEEITNRILDKLRLTLSGEDKKLITRRYTDNTEAYQLYLRGRYFLNKRSAEAIKKGRDFFQQAIDEDPAYALAYSGISDSYTLLAAQAGLSPQEAYPAALAAALKSVELDAALGEGHASLAHVKFHLGDLQTAELEFARAIALKPSYAPAYLGQAEYLEATGRRDEAFAATRKALEIDPLDLATNAQLGALLMGMQEYDKAITQLKKTLEIDQNYFLAHAYLGTIYLQSERFPEAIAEFKQVASLTVGSRGLGGLGLAYAKSGRSDEARGILGQMQARSKESYVDPLEVARIYAVLKEKEQTLAWLEKAYSEMPQAVNQLKNNRDFDFLRSDLRFTKML